MPELPEVETVVRTLESLIKDAQIKDVVVYYPKIIDTKSFVSNVKNQHFRVFERKGKFLIFGLDHGFLVAHLRMEGKFYVVKDGSMPIDKHIHVVFKLEDGRELYYHDTRKFGRLGFYETLSEHAGLQRLGPEIWDANCTFDYFSEKCQKRQTPIKSLLLDQSVISGIGNIYANEILFAARVNPMSPASKVSPHKLELILSSTRMILDEAIAAGGTSIRSYTSSLGVTGRFQQSLKVHNREGEECFICHRPIKKIMVNNRGTYYCSHCQRKSPGMIK